MCGGSEGRVWADLLCKSIHVAILVDLTGHGGCQRPLDILLGELPMFVYPLTCHLTKTARVYYVPAFRLGKSFKQSLSRSFQTAGKDRSQRITPLHVNCGKRCEGGPQGPGELVSGGSEPVGQGGWGGLSRSRMVSFVTLQHSSVTSSERPFQTTMSQPSLLLISTVLYAGCTMCTVI